jgi:hypothetical protein
MTDQLDLGDERLANNLQLGVRLLTSLHDADTERMSFLPSERPGPETHSALLAAMLVVNALLTAAAAQCNRTLPPENIEIQTARDGRLIYRCRHPNSHSWELDGTVI